MPYVIRKIKNKNLYTVINKTTGKVHSSGTSKANAEKQIRLLNAIEHGYVIKK